MPNYYYDGSFDGLLTVIYIAYKDRKNNALRITVKTEQLLLELDDINVITDFSKSRCVEKSICDKLSKNFLMFNLLNSYIYISRVIGYLYQPK